MKKLGDLEVGVKGVINSFTDEALSLKFMEMGCLPGSKVMICRKAPFGDPLVIEVPGSHLTIRKSEALSILVQTEF